MLTNRLSRAALAAVAMLSLAGLTACAPETPAPDPAESETPVSSETPSAEEPTADCLVGDWFIEQDELQGFYDVVAESSDGLSFDVEGGTGLSFTDTEYTYTPDFTLMLDIAGMSGEGVTSGSINGEYTADGEVITTMHEESDISLIVTVGGTTSDASDVSGSLLSSAPINSAPYSCGSEGPIIEFSTGGDARVPVQLTPAG